MDHRLNLLLSNAELKVGTFDIHARREMQTFKRSIPFCVMSYHKKGRAKLRIGDQIHNIEPGTVVYIPPNVEHDHYKTTNEETVFLWWHWAMIIPNFGLAMPFAIFMMRAFFRDIPDDLAESAKIDGCGDFRTFWYILMPLVIPAITALLVFEFSSSWNDFLLPLLFVYDDAYRTLPLGLMYFSGEYTTNQSLVAAGVSIAVVPIIIVYVIFQRKFIEGITAGSVKG